MARRRKFLTLHGSTRDFTHTWALWFPAGAVVMRDVSEDELGSPALHDPRILFRAADDYAQAKGFVGAYPTFVESGGDYDRKHRLALFSEVVADRCEVSADDIGDALDHNIRHYFGRFSQVAERGTREFMGGFPTGHVRTSGGRAMHGLIRIRRLAALSARLLCRDVGDVFGDDYPAISRGVQRLAAARGYAFAFHNGWWPELDEAEVAHDFLHVQGMRHLIEQEGWELEQAQPFAPATDGDGVVHYVMAVVLAKDE